MTTGPALLWGVRARLESNVRELKASLDAVTPRNGVAQRSRFVGCHLDDQPTATFERHAQHDAAAFLGDLERAVSSPRLHRRHVFPLPRKLGYFALSVPGAEPHTYQ